MSRVIEDLKWFHKTLGTGGKTAEFYESQKDIILQALVVLEKQIKEQNMGTYLLGITINDSQLINVYDEDGECLAENWCSEEEMKGYIKALEDLGYRERFK